MDNRRSRSFYVYLFVILGLALAIACLLFYIVPYRYGLTKSIAYSPSDVALDNPLTGYAPPATNVEECEDSQLVYIGVTWAEWEPEEGVYDTESLERKFNITRWKAEGKHAVLRFMCDVPGKEQHMDIPRWLYQRTQDGVYYDVSYGQGYCPDYENTVFRERHALAIQALATYCNQDTFVAYVELGSLGHWGEWHTTLTEDVPPLPDAEVCNEYVLDYSNNFHNARLLMRRNFSIAAEGGLGLYNDLAGDLEQTQKWLDWLKNGGSYETDGEPLHLTPIRRFWEQAPVGGELTQEYSMDELLGRRMKDTLETVEAGHMSFIGPNCPTEDLKDSDSARELRESMGYRIYISELRTEYSFKDDCLNVFMTWRNTGLAPLYWDWPVTMYVYDRDGELKYWEDIEIQLSKLVPGESIITESQIPFTDLFRQGFQVGVGIVSPEGGNHVRLAMDGEERNGTLVIYTYE